MEKTRTAAGRKVEEQAAISFYGNREELEDLTRGEAG